MDEKKGVHQAVEDSNIRFYKAFETLSIGKMGDRFGNIVMILSASILVGKWLPVGQQ
jgi:hypothetical protein